MLLAEVLYVQVRSTKLRSEPKHWAKPVKELKYGDPVSKKSYSKGWYNVSYGKDSTGFIHESAITKKKVAFSSGSSGKVKAEGSDLVLAGKGFNRDVEKKFASSGKRLDYNTVNQVEQFSVPEEDLAKFIEDGKLSG